MGDQALNAFDPKTIAIGGPKKGPSSPANSSLAPNAREARKLATPNAVAIATTNRNHRTLIFFTGLTAAVAGGSRPQAPARTRHASLPIQTPTDGELT